MLVVERCTLPSAWSALPNDLYVGLWRNPNITGTIPASCANNTGTYFDFSDTGISGCVPPGLIGDFYTQQTLPNKTVVLRDLPICSNSNP
ncbi:hypothetical protein OEZ86_005003 [Tetradesmus obliquus]|nr:hypothetical protein OEZ86_005003 [Tetradesmus obliquus]